MLSACYIGGMSNVQVKNLEPELHELLRVRAAGEGSTISDYVLALIRRDLRKPARRQWLDSVAQLSRHDFTRDEIANALESGRSRR